MVKKKHKKSVEKASKKVLKEIEMSNKKAGIDASRDPQSSQKKEKRSLPLRIFIQFAKTIFIRLPVFIIIVIIIVFIGLKIYLTPKRVETLVVNTFRDISYGEISLNVKEFSPYGGFIIEDIIIRNGKEFNKTKLVNINRLVVKYGFFRMFTGNIRFSEIGIYNPRIYLKERNGVWNVSRLMKPGEKAPEETVAEEKEAPSSDEISLPISVDFFMKFILDDLRVYVKGSKFRSSLKGLTLNMDVDIPPFKKIPKSIKAVSLLKKMNIVLNPREGIDVSYYSKDVDVTPPLILTWKLIFNKDKKGTPRFNSRFKFGTYKSPVRFKSSHLTPLNFMVSYDIYYNPFSDHLSLNHFGVKFRDKKWIYLAGNIRSVTKIPKIDLKMNESSISLNDLYPYYRSITGDRRTRFSGNLSLYPLTIKGNPDNMDINGEINLQRLYFKNPSAEATIPGIIYSYSVIKRKNDMKFLSKLSIPHLFYTLKGSKSGDNALELNTDIAVVNNFSSLVINNLGFRFYNPVLKRNVINMLISGNVKLQPGMSGKININKFRFMKMPLTGMLPDRYQKKIKKIPINKPVDMNLDLTFGMNEKRIGAVLGMLIRVPDYKINDLRIMANVLQDNKQKVVHLKKFHLGSREKNFSLSANGFVELKKMPISDSDLKLLVKLNNPEMKTMFDKWKSMGLFQMDARVKGDLANGKAYGSVKFDRLFVKNDEQKLSVENVNLDFPFEYHFKARQVEESLIRVKKSQVIDNEFFRDKQNFTISSIKAKHPARETSIEYLKDFTASMYFRDNVFTLGNMKAYVLDGSLYGRDIIFNLADFKRENMEFNLILDVTNVDVAKLDEQEPKAKTRDAELSLNANFSGRGLNVQKELMVKGYINIHKIGEKFANMLMKGLSTEKGKSKLGILQPIVDNAMNIESFHFNLDKGLVYPKVKLNRRILSYVTGIKVHNNTIEFDRIPIQEYLRKVRRGD